MSEILQHPYTLNKAERSSSGEIYVDLSHTGAKRQEFWFDPKANYLVRKSVMVPAADGNYRWEHEVVVFSEPAPGVFVPSTVEDRLILKGKQEAVVRTVLTDLKVNHAMPATALRVPGVEGRSCLDLDRDSRYDVDADGNRTGPETPEKVTRISPEAVGSSARGPSGPRQPHDLLQTGQDPTNSSARGPARFEPGREPTPWWVWLLCGSGFVIVTGLGLGAIRRRRQVRENGDVGQNEQGW
ncbi:hypothetical protein [Frigoriglobus tundricola]|uniref:hypothetical protein n=1 Tax=Frigoriglobus tundricola TaxID=2774151 RepID=UPI00148EAE1F|nr:hypothetical protein [Frigoriglobus tundricola]